MIEALPIPYTVRRILVAPLNWGLGHATRCIPIIRHLLAQQKQIIIASDGAALALLQAEFPQLTYITLPAYNITYPHRSMVLNMLRLSPNIIVAIWREHRQLKHIIKTHHIDFIISDNRFGCYSSNVPSVCVTHQINLPVAVPFAGYMNRLLLKKFEAVWIPDVADSPNLSGKLSHPTTGLRHVHYIGTLSRMTEYERPKKYAGVVILSGPEPQRSNLETVLLQQLCELPYHQFLVVRGVTATPQRYQYAPNIIVENYLTADALNDALMSCDFVISRTGYTTVMDVVSLQKNALLIPTPQQPEQEYLATHLQQHPQLLIQKQTAINVTAAIAAWQHAR